MKVRHYQLHAYNLCRDPIYPYKVLSNKPSGKFVSVVDNETTMQEVIRDVLHTGYIQPPVKVKEYYVSGVNDPEALVMSMFFRGLHDQDWYPIAELRKV